MSTPTPPTATGTSGISLRSVVRYDLPASLVVFLVALPLSIGIAIASGAPVESGLIAAIVGGIVASCLGGSAVQVSGPAAGLTVVVAELIQEFGFATTCLITALAGLLQIAFGLSRIARGALAIAPVVVHAMLAGIGITIALQQVHVLLGGSPASEAWHNVVQLPDQLMHLHVHDVIVGLSVVAIMVGWRWMPAKVRLVPGPLVAVLAGTVMAMALFPDIARITLSGSIFDAINLPSLPHDGWDDIAVGVVTIALATSVQTLLSAVAVDKMHSGPRTNFDRELIGQGSANFVSGMLAGLPVAGVIVRSSANVQAGARTRASAVLHGVWLLLFSVALVSMVEKIPTAALAGLLIVVGMQLVKIAHIKLAHRTGDLVIYGATVLGVVFVNLLEGVLIGLAIAFVLLLWRIVKVTIDSGPKGEIPQDGWLVSISGSLTFLALPKLSSALAEVPAGVPVEVEMHVDFLDHATYDTIHQWAQQHKSTGGTVHFEEFGSARMGTVLNGPPVKEVVPQPKVKAAEGSEWEDILVKALERS